MESIRILHDDGEQIDFINRRLAAQIAPQVERGRTFAFIVTDITGGEYDEAYGLNMAIIIHDGASEKEIERYLKEVLFPRLGVPFPEPAAPPSDPKPKIPTNSKHQLVTCPSCGKIHKAPAEYIGRRVKCPCGAKFIANASN